LFSAEGEYGLSTTDRTTAPAPSIGVRESVDTSNKVGIISPLKELQISSILVFSLLVTLSAIYLQFKQ